MVRADKEVSMDEIRCAIEFRADQDRLSPGRIVGELLTEGERANDRAEVFERGSLSWAGEIVLNRQHKRDAPIMRFEPRRDGDRIMIDAALPDTTAGRDAAQEIRGGLMRGLSIEFRAVKERFEGGVRLIAEGVLGAAALVDESSYRTAVEVRGRGERRRRVWL